MADQPHSHSLRTGRHTQAGQIYLLTTVTADRQPVFADFQAARCLIRCLQQAALLRQADTLAFVVMPDHLHWLMQLGEGIDLSRCMGSVKSITARQLGIPFWQKGFHDHMPCAKKRICQRWPAMWFPILCGPAWSSVLVNIRTGMPFGCDQPSPRGRGSYNNHPWERRPRRDRALADHIPSPRGRGSYNNHP